MFRRCLCAVVAVIVLSGCSAVKDPERIASSVRDTYAAASSIDLVADITSDLDEETMTYQIGYAYERQEENASAVMTILAPESIAGITATVTGEDFSFSYDDTELETAMPDRKGLTPADVMTYLLYDLMHAVPAQVWTEGDLIALRFEETTEEGAVVKEVYLNSDTGALSDARIYCDGKQIMRCIIDTCTMNGK